MMEIALILAAFFVGTIFGGVAAKMAEECPRQIRGYSCQGEKCDHSRKAVAEAKYDMEHRLDDGDGPNFWRGGQA